MDESITGAVRLLMNPRNMPSRFSVDEERHPAQRPHGRRHAVQFRPTLIIRILRQHLAARAASSRNLSAAGW